jgi:polyhydroxyalkanoate synthesis repressor PhaR
MQRMRRDVQVKMPMNPEVVVIKKYGNRRMYNTCASRYVNLDDLAALVREGRQVKVVDAKSGEDLTRVTLTQIITEDAKEQPTGLPLELLRQLIVASDKARQEFIMWYLKSAFDTYQTVQDAVADRFSQLQTAFPSPAEAMKRFLSPSRAPQQTAETGSELDSLRQRIADLEANLRKASAKKPRRRKT